MSYILKIDNQNITVPLNDPEKLWSLKEFNPKLPLVMVITGWTTNFNDTENPTLDKIYAAYRCRGNVNFVVCFHLNFVLLLQFLTFYISFDAFKNVNRLLTQVWNYNHFIDEISFKN